MEDRFVSHGLVNSGGPGTMGFVISSGPWKPAAELTAGAHKDPRPLPGLSAPGIPVAGIDEHWSQRIPVLEPSFSVLKIAPVQMASAVQGAHLKVNKEPAF